jgi:hypothetical protein
MSEKPVPPTGIINTPAPTSPLSEPPTDTDETDDVPPETLDPPAIFANGYYITASEGLTRISFGESSEGAMTRLMTNGDALALAKLILSLLDE